MVLSRAAADGKALAPGLRVIPTKVVVFESVSKVCVEVSNVAATGRVLPGAT
jgi:hypothetical protein